MTTAPAVPASVEGADTFALTAEEQTRFERFANTKWIIENLEGPRELVDGQMLDPKQQYYLEGRRRRTPEEVKRGLEMFDDPQGRIVARAALAREWTIFTQVTTPMRKVEERRIDGPRGPIPIRIYTPQVTDSQPLPILVYFHGGGWLYGNLQAVDRCVRLIANEARAIVVNVDYGLAPETPYPGGVDDGEAAYLWAREHASELGSSADMIGVGGDSAGGRLALTICHRQIEAGRPTPLLQLLYYTSVGASAEQPSMKLFANGYGLDANFLSFMTPRIYPGAGTAERASKELREAKFSQMPAAIVVTAGFDMLRDAGRSLARRFEEARVAVTYLNYPSLTHGFLQWSGVIEDAQHAAVDTARLFGTAIRSRLSIVRSAHVVD